MLTAALWIFTGGDIGRSPPFADLGKLTYDIEWRLIHAGRRGARASQL